MLTLGLGAMLHSGSCQRNVAGTCAQTWPCLADFSPDRQSRLLPDSWFPSLDLLCSPYSIMNSEVYVYIHVPEYGFSHKKWKDLHVCMCLCVWKASGEGCHSRLSMSMGTVTRWCVWAAEVYWCHWGHWPCLGSCSAFPCWAACSSGPWGIASPPSEST